MLWSLDFIREKDRASFTRGSQTHQRAIGQTSVGLVCGCAAFRAESLRLSDEHPPNLYARLSLAPVWYGKPEAFRTGRRHSRSEKPHRTPRLAVLVWLRYIHCRHDAEGSHNGSAAVLKTADRKVMQVRVLSPPPYLPRQTRCLFPRSYHGRSPKPVRRLRVVSLCVNADFGSVTNHSCGQR